MKKCGENRLAEALATYQESRQGAKSYPNIFNKVFGKYKLIEYLD